MGEVERGLPLSALDRVALAVAPGNAGFAFAWCRARPWRGDVHTPGSAHAGRECPCRQARFGLGVRQGRLAADEADPPILSGGTGTRMRRPVVVVLAGEFGRPLVEAYSGQDQIWHGSVTAQLLDRVLTTYRIGDPDGAYPIFDATGSRIAPGRWNTADSPLIYTSEHYSTAMLEILANGMGRLPANQHFIQVTVPNGVSYEMLNPAICQDGMHRGSRPAGLWRNLADVPPLAPAAGAERHRAHGTECADQSRASRVPAHHP